MFKREKTILINTSVDKVFSYVANISRHAEWAANTLEIRHTAGPESGEGATYESVIHSPAGIAGSFKGQIRVLHEESPHRFVYETFDTTGQYRWYDGSGTFLMSSSVSEKYVVVVPHPARKR